MKIAFFIGVFPSLSETFILNQITGMIDAGHEVQIIAWNSQRESRVHDDVLRYKLQEKVLYARMPENKLLRVIKTAALFILHYPGNAALLRASLDRSRFGKEATSLRLFYLAILFLRKKFDIVHCHYGFNGLLGVYLKELGLVRKVVTTFHAYDMTVYIEKYGPGVYQDLFAGGDRFLPVSEYWRQKLLTLGCPPGKVQVHHMGVDIERITPAGSKDTQGNLILLTVGRLVEKKGHAYVIQALSLLKKKNKHSTYLIAGDGPLRGRLKSFAVKEGVSECVRFLGPCTQEEILRLYHAAHIFVLTSITTREKEMEGIPVALIEAMAAGIPVVSTHHSAIPELVSNGASGFLLAEKDVSGLAERIEYLIDNPKERAELGGRGREIVAEQFNIKTLNAALAAMYNEIAGSAG